MPIRKGNHSKRRHMYFRESSKRDPAISQKEEQEKYNKVLCQYCSNCMEKYNLLEGIVPRRLGVCGICGADGFINGSLYSLNEAIVKAKKEYK